jgi:hypothetical protein
MLASNGERMPPWGVPVRLAVEALFGEDPGPQERLHPSQDTLVPDPTSHPAHQGRVVDLIEARRDVRLEHPLVVTGRRSEVVDLSDSVPGSALRTKPVAARVEIRLEDRLEHQLQRGLHDPVTGRRDPETTDLARRLGDRLLPHPLRSEPAGLEIVSQPAQHPHSTGTDRAGCHPVDSGGASEVPSMGRAVGRRVTLAGPRPCCRLGSRRRCTRGAVKAGAPRRTNDLDRSGRTGTPRAFVDVQRCCGNGVD